MIVSRPVVVVFTEVRIYFSPKEPVAELRVPMFQLSLTRDDLDTDSAMGVSIFMDDRSMCTFATEEEVSEFVCVHYTFLPRMRCWYSVCIILLYSALCTLHAGGVFVCVGLCIGCALGRSVDI